MDQEKSAYPSGPPPNYHQVTGQGQQDYYHHQASAPPPPPGLGAVYVNGVPAAAQSAPAAGGQWPQTVPTVVYVNSGSGFGAHPQRVICPICSADVLTINQHTSGLFAYLMSGFLCLIGCWPCCLLPCFMDSCMDVEHKCPSCHHKIGINKRI